MRYRCALTIAAGTAESAPATEIVELCAGYITEIVLLFPPGQAGLTYVQIWRQERQIFPTTPGEAFRGDDHAITFGERWPIDELPHSVEVRGWAPSATLDHTVYVDVSIAEAAREPAAPWGSIPLPEGMQL